MKEWKGQEGRCLPGEKLLFNIIVTAAVRGQGIRGRKGGWSGKIEGLRARRPAGSYTL